MSKNMSLPTTPTELPAQRKRRGDGEPVSSEPVQLSSLALAFADAGFHLSGLITSPSQIDGEVRLAAQAATRNVSFYVCVFADGVGNVIYCIERHRSAVLDVRQRNTSYRPFVAAVTSSQDLLAPGSRFYNAHFL